ncbi:lipase 3-like [Hyposmocoma kahamanoa]|uniref:lipase 3-like n=1 Tax=Hyposmocoma kahamanoa TaxID=1477025 RepID=UPI000E6D8623|nr:lipase 3-like [Hyposmocoma kahamanoa]
MRSFYGGSTLTPSGLVDVFTSNQNLLTDSLIATGINTEELDLLNNVPVKTAENYKKEFARGSLSEDINLNITQSIKKYGYQTEEHETHTEDGYILTMFRIPQNGPTVFLMHGLLGSADDWITPGPDSGLAYLLAIDGYDVWMGNARGNKHSRRHVRLSPDKDRETFWDFSWNEIGRIDLPAMIDYILCVTNQPTLKYVGFSQGTTSFFVMASERPDYNDKISLMVALSPVVWMTHVKSPLLRLIAPINPYIHAMFMFIGVHEFLPSNRLIKSIEKKMCGNVILSQLICSNILFLLCGFNYKQLNITNLPVIYAHIPSGASTKQLVHYGQGIVSGEFQKFDYGTKKNMQKYNSKVPPKYHVERVTSPVALFYSVEDWFSNITDVNVLQKTLPNVVDAYVVPDKKFNHIDFTYAKDLKTLIYSRLSKLFKKF